MSPLHYGSVTPMAAGTLSPMSSREDPYGPVTGSEFHPEEDGEGDKDNDTVADAFDLALASRAAATTLTQPFGVPNSQVARLGGGRVSLRHKMGLRARQCGSALFGGEWR